MSQQIDATIASLRNAGAGSIVYIRPPIVSRHPDTISSASHFITSVITILMQSAHHSDAASGESEVPSHPATHPPTNGFKITLEDANIFRGYMNEFEAADTQMRRRILEKVIGEVYRLRPSNSTFDKKKAKKVFIQTIHMHIGLLTYTHISENQKMVL